MHRQHDCRAWRTVLRHGLRKRRVVKQRVRRPRLAGDCAGHLHHLALERWRVRVDSLRRTLHPAHVYPDRLKSGGEGTVQNAPLHRDHRGAVHFQPAQEAGGPAAAAFGAAIL